MQIAVDEAAPGANIMAKHGTMYPFTDRTHRVALDGKVKVEYTANTTTTSIEAPVRAQKVVKLHINILKDQSGVNGKAVIADADVQKDVDRMREIYAQAAIRVDVVGNKFSVVDPPPLVNLMNGLDEVTTLTADKKYVLTDEEKALLGHAAYRTPTDANGKDDIEIYYINEFSGPTEGLAYTQSVLTADDSKYAQSVILKTTPHDYHVLAHESAHILEARPAGTDAHSPYGARPRSPVDQVNLLVRGMDSDLEGNETDSRRLTADQQARMRGTVPALLSDP